MYSDPDPVEESSIDHISRNTSRSLLKCPVCEKVFTNSSALAKHKLTHSDERRYVCEICSKAFKRQDHLNGHKLTHQEKKPHSCPMTGCQRSYSDARSLRRHIENHHRSDLTRLLSEVAIDTSSSATGSAIGASSMTRDYQSSGVNDAESPATADSRRSSTGFSGSLAAPGVHTDQSASIILEPTIASLAIKLLVNGSSNANGGDDSEHVIKSEPTASGVSAASPSDALIPAALLRNLNQLNPYECTHCRRRFISQASLNGHMRTHGGFHAPPTPADNSNSASLASPRHSDTRGNTPPPLPPTASAHPDVTAPHHSGSLVHSMAMAMDDIKPSLVTHTSAVANPRHSATAHGSSTNWEPEVHQTRLKSPPPLRAERPPSSNEPLQSRSAHSFRMAQSPLVTNSQPPERFDTHPPQANVHLPQTNDVTLASQIQHAHSDPLASIVSLPSSWPGASCLPLGVNQLSSFLERFNTISPLLQRHTPSELQAARTPDLLPFASNPSAFLGSTSALHLDAPSLTQFSPLIAAGVGVPVSALTPPMPLLNLQPPDLFQVPAMQGFSQPLPIAPIAIPLAPSLLSPAQLNPFLFNELLRQQQQQQQQLLQAGGRRVETTAIDRETNVSPEPLSPNDASVQPTRATQFHSQQSAPASTAMASSPNPDSPGRFSHLLAAAEMQMQRKSPSHSSRPLYLFGEHTSPNQRLPLPSGYSLTSSEQLSSSTYDTPSSSRMSTAQRFATSASQLQSRSASGAGIHLQSAAAAEMQSALELRGCTQPELADIMLGAGNEINYGPCSLSDIPISAEVESAVARAQHLHPMPPQYLSDDEPHEHYMQQHVADVPRSHHIFVPPNAHLTQSHEQMTRFGQMPANEEPATGPGDLPLPAATDASSSQEPTLIQYLRGHPMPPQASLFDESHELELDDPLHNFFKKRHFSADTALLPILDGMPSASRLLAPYADEELALSAFQPLDAFHDVPAGAQQPHLLQYPEVHTPPSLHLQHVNRSSSPRLLHTPTVIPSSPAPPASPALHFPHPPSHLAARDPDTASTVDTAASSGYEIHSHPQIGPSTDSISFAAAHASQPVAASSHQDSASTASPHQSLVAGGDVAVSSAGASQAIERSAIDHRRFAARRRFPSVPHVKRSFSLTGYSYTGPKMKRARRPLPLNIPPALMGAAEAAAAGQALPARSLLGFGYPSLFNRPAAGGDLTVEQQLNNVAMALLQSVPYTPPPILSPVRNGPGLFCSLNRPRRSSGVNTAQPPGGAGADSHLQAENNMPIALPPQSSESTENLDELASNYEALFEAEQPLIIDEEEEEEEEEDESADWQPLAASADLSPRINVGDKYQATLPSLRHQRFSSEQSREQLLIDPRALETLSDEHLNAYLRVASSKALPFGGLNKDLALIVLTHCEGNLRDALRLLLDGRQHLVEFLGGHHLSDLYLPETAVWQPLETELFYKSIIKVGKDFHRLSGELNRRAMLVQTETLSVKSTKQCVEFYFVWKKFCPDEYRRLKKRIQQMNYQLSFRKRTEAAVDAAPDFSALPACGPLHIDLNGEDHVSERSEAGGESDSESSDRDDRTASAEECDKFEISPPSPTHRGSSSRKPPPQQQHDDHSNGRSGDAANPNVSSSAVSQQQQAAFSCARCARAFVDAKALYEHIKSSSTCGSVNSPAAQRSSQAANSSQRAAASSPYAPPPTRTVPSLSSAAMPSGFV